MKYLYWRLWCHWHGVCWKHAEAKSIAFSGFKRCMSCRFSYQERRANKFTAALKELRRFRGIA